LRKQYKLKIDELGGGQLEDMWLKTNKGKLSRREIKEGRVLIGERAVSWDWNGALRTTPYLVSRTTPFRKRSPVQWNGVERSTEVGQGR
jgi:hypothetical protein